ncbi:MAG: hypothetical protein ABJD11_17030 [Gemmatimonadota bacterium]
MSIFLRQLRLYGTIASPCGRLFPMLAAGMEEGPAVGTDRLAELLRELQQEHRNR